MPEHANVMAAFPLPVTAWSAVNSLGRSTEAVFASLRAGVRGLGPSPVPVPFDAVVGAIPGELPSLPPDRRVFDCRQARIGRMAFSQLAPAVHRAVDRWGPDRIAVILGTSTGGIEQTESAYQAWRSEGRLPEGYDLHCQHDFEALAEYLARTAGIGGPCYVVSTACSSAGKVAASAARLIAAGVVDAALVGGVDSLTRKTLCGFHSLGILSPEPCRPFCAERAGINIGEGAALFLLEREGDSPVSLLGVGESADAYRMSSPEPSGRGAREAMARALDQAGLAPGEVDYVNAHGTATKLNDVAEAAAIASLFGDKVPVASTKGATGHLLGAAGATGIVFAIDAIRTGFLPPTLGAEPLDPAVRIDVLTAPRNRPVRRALCNAFAFGGSNVSVLLGDAS